MRFRPFGSTGIKVSEMGFGAWAIGGHGYGPTDDRESLKALEAAAEHGINFYDTADTYGSGHSEDLIAQFLKNKPRDQFFVATKAGWNFYEEPVRKVFEPEYIKRACEKSLKRLNSEVIDLYQLHNPSLKQIESGEAVTALDELKKQGKIRFAGISVHREEEAMAALEDSRVDSLQLILNMLDQRMASKVLARCHSRGVAVIVREPLACGLLTGKYDADYDFPKGDHRRRWDKQKRRYDFEKTERLKTAFDAGQVPLAQAALEYVLSYEEVSVVIPGAKNAAQVESNLKAVEDSKLDASQLNQIKEIFKEEIFSKGLNPS